jgi:PEP-CTERM motif
MRKLGIFGAAITAAVLLAAPARASIVLSGTTAGCFESCGSYGTTNVTDMGLTFNGSSFNTQTNNKGFATIFNLGTFSLSNATDDYDGQTFSLQINFSSPATTSPNPGTFSAVVNGSVDAGPSGGATVTFSPDKEWFSFQGGIFSLQINPVSPEPGGINPLEISAQVQAVPEPGTWALMGIGFACLGLMAYRRRGRGATFRFA